MVIVWWASLELGYYYCQLHFGEILDVGKGQCRQSIPVLFIAKSIRYSELAGSSLLSTTSKPLLFLPFLYIICFVMHWGQRNIFQLVSSAWICLMKTLDALKIQFIQSFFHFIFSNLTFSLPHPLALCFKHALVKAILFLSFNVS